MTQQEAPQFRAGGRLRVRASGRTGRLVTDEFYSARWQVHACYLEWDDAPGVLALFLSREPLAQVADVAVVIEAKQ